MNFFYLFACVVVSMVYSVMSTPFSTEPRCPDYDKEKELLTHLSRIESSISGLGVLFSQMGKTVVEKYLARHRQPEEENSTMVAFKAKDLRNYAVQPMDTLQFTTVQLNIGEAYDPATGIFTAPVSGIYMFNLQLCTLEGDAWIRVELFSNYRQGVCEVADTDWEVCGSSQFLVDMKAGDEALVKVLGRNSGSDNVLKRRDDYWNTFSGYLLGAKRID